MIKYRHKETGLFLKKFKQGYSSVYSLDSKGTTWQRHCLGTLGLTKSSEFWKKDSIGKEPFFRQDQFEKVEYDVVEKYQIENQCLRFLSFVEDNYYYSSSCWSNCDTDEVTSRSEIYQEFLKSKK
jgi:hypothetical protein